MTTMLPKSPEPTPVGAVRSAIAVHAASRWWLMHTSRAIVLLAVATTALVGCRHTTFTRTATTRPVMDITPGIDIFADGHCVVRTFQGQELERKLQPSAVCGLLDFFERQGLFSISDESIERAIDRELQPVRKELQDGGFTVATRWRMVVVDSSYTRIAAQTLSKKVEISRYALHSELEHYRTVTELRTVQQCVERVYEVAGKIE